MVGQVALVVAVVDGLALVVLAQEMPEQEIHLLYHHLKDLTVEK